MRRLVPAAVLLLAACGSLYTTVHAPQGLVCDRIKVVADNLGSTLAAAQPGDCVIAGDATFVGSFVLPKDVTLAASEGALVVLKGDGSANPVLTVEGGPRSTVRGVRIDTSSGGGIAIDPGPANLVGVSIGGTSKSSLSVSCTGTDCDQRETVVEDTNLTDSTTGLVVSGARVRVVRGRIAGMAGASLSAGSGVVAMNRARLTLEGVTVEGNQAVGVLIDGPGTRATLTDCAIRSNDGRGVWIQGATDGGVSITGGEISGNQLMGVGARSSSGLTLTGVTIEDTVSVRVPTNIGQYEDIGDGVGLFSGVSGVLLENVVARRNARAQILADEFGAQVRVINPDVSGGLYRIVLQRSSATVDVPTQLVDNPGRVLAVENSLQTVP